MYKTETHLHTSEVSGCAKLPAETMVQLYHQQGYNTIFVSDHYYAPFFEKFERISWEEKVTMFLAGYYRAKAAGEKLGMNVLFSAEFAFQHSLNHYLVYGVDRNFLERHPDITDMTIQEFSQIAKENNLFVVQAHPYRDNICYPTPEYIDGMEVYNSNPRHLDFSEKAEQIAREYRLPMLAGSDAHREEDVGGAGILSEHEIKTAEEFIEVIKSGKYQLFMGTK